MAVGGAPVSPAHRVDIITIGQKFGRPRDSFSGWFSGFDEVDFDHGSSFVTQFKLAKVGGHSFIHLLGNDNVVLPSLICAL